MHNVLRLLVTFAVSLIKWGAVVNEDAMSEGEGGGGVVRGGGGGVGV